MGKYCIYKYKNYQWISLGSTNKYIEDRLQRIHTNSDYVVEKSLLEKYYPNRKLLNPEESNYSLKEMYKNVALEDLVYLTSTYEKKSIQWYEKIFLRVDENHVVISKESLSKVIKGLELIEKKYPLSIPAQNGFPEFQSKAKGLSELFKTIEMEDGEYLSIGHSTGGFWGNELPENMESIIGNSLEESENYQLDQDELMDFLSEKFNYPPEAAREICFDIELT